MREKGKIGEAMHLDCEVYTQQDLDVDTGERKIIRQVQKDHRSSRNMRMLMLDKEHL